MKTINNNTNIKYEKIEEEKTITEIVALVILFFLTGWLAQYAWNNIIIEMFGGKRIEYSETLILLLLFRLLARRKAL